MPLVDGVVAAGVVDGVAAGVVDGVVAAGVVDGVVAAGVVVVSDGMVAGVLGLTVRQIGGGQNGSGHINFQ